MLVQFPDITGLMDKLGVKLEEVKSSPLKAEPSPFNPTTDEERAMIRSMILDSYDWFVGLVDERRPLTRSEVAALADGSVFTGRQALQKKLVDELGGENEAIGWLATKGVDGELKVIEWKAEGRRLVPVLRRRWPARSAGSSDCPTAALLSLRNSAPSACSLTVSCQSGTLKKPCGATEKDNKIIRIFVTERYWRGPRS